jgi:hypothetical protein
MDKLYQWCGAIGSPQLRKYQQALTAITDKG